MRVKFQYLINYPYAEAIYFRADRILKNRTEQSRISGYGKLREWIDEYSENRFQEELEIYIDQYAQKLEERGGWELGYFPDRYRDDRGVYQFNYRDAVYLLENWPDMGNPPDGYPEQCQSDIEGLEEVTCGGYPYDNIEGFLKASVAECYAVIALSKVVAAQNELSEGKGYCYQTDWTVRKMLSATEHIVEAMEIICVAEQILRDEKSLIFRKEQQHKEEIELRKEIRKSIAQNAAIRKLQKDPKQVAKLNVKECWERWQKNPNEYKSKSAFARAMLEKYEALESQKVITDRWCAEWEREKP